LNTASGQHKIGFLVAVFDIPVKVTIGE